MDLIQNNLGGQLGKQLTGGVSLQQMNPLNTGNKVDKASTADSIQSFGQLLNDQMQEINNLQANANKAVETFATGGDIELHNVVLSVEKADMALQLATQVRNKLVSSYQEVSRMQF